MNAPDVPPDIRAAFDALSAKQASALRDLRKLIFTAAGEQAEIGALTETLKWGQPSYAPARPRIGSSVRLGVSKSDAVALFFICNTNLVDQFRELYAASLRFEKNRAIIMPTAKGEWPVADLKHCIAMALTYHLRRR
ncbi:MAG: DUF1801 domain-containing protein [Pseudomonadota bacterium]